MKTRLTRGSFALALIVGFALIASNSHAQKSKRKKKSDPEAVLNFKADVIQGEKRRPRLFLEFESHAPNLDSIIFQRKDFNEFHRQDMSRRFRYQPAQ